MGFHYILNPPRMQECRQTRDRTNGHLVDSNTEMIELSSPSVKSVVYVKTD